MDLVRPETSRHVPPGKQPAVIRRLALEAIDYIEQNNLVTIPQLAKDSWRIGMMSPARQRYNPFFTGGSTISVSYPHDEMGHADKLMSMRGNNPHFSAATVHHELIPGHHLQDFMTSRYNTHRSIYRTVFWTEGWALYAERLAKEIPRHQFKIPIQGVIGGTVIARSTIAPFRKDVTEKLYGGDVTRKKKLLEKQKKGKAKMKQFGQVNIPQKAFVSVLRADQD